MNDAVLLLRVSHSSQVDGYSLDAQRAETERWCATRGLNILSTFLEEGVSARTDKLAKRPHLQTILAMAQQKQFSVLVTHTLDRLARNQKVQRHVLETLGNAGIGFASVVEGIDYTTPTGKLVMSVMGSVHEFFSDQLAVHVSKAQKQRAHSGLPAGPVPFGYRAMEPGGVPELIADEAQALQELFDRRAAGESMGEIAEWLNHRGLQTRSANRFTAHAVRDLLENPFFHGIVKYKGELLPGQHEAIVTKEMFDRVQARRGPAKSSRKVWGSVGALQGRIYCGNCGSPLQSDRHHQGTPMYRERHALECFSNGKSSVAGPLDDQIAKIIASVELAPSWRQRMAELAGRPFDGPSVAELQERQRKYTTAYFAGGLSDSQYKARMAEVGDAIRLATAVAPPSYEEVVKLFENIEWLWKEATGEERRRLISPLIERVYVDMELKLVGAIRPTPAFRALLQCAVQKSGSDVFLVSQGDLERAGVWSWWRRGRIELPVQKKNVRDLLQA